MLMLLGMAGMAVAQNNTNSPYTRYGYGQLVDQGPANSKGMGGIAYGVRDKNHVNFVNPASYSAVDSLTFIFDGGVSLQNTNFSNGTLKTNAKNSSFDYVSMLFRAAPWCGVSLGVLPYSNVGYGMTGTLENSGNADNSAQVTYAGDGGLHQAYIGASFKLFKDFSVGANISYLWGDIIHMRGETYPSDASVFPLTIQNTMTVRSYKLDIGAQYTFNVGKKHAVTLGAVFTPGHDLSNSIEILTQTGNSTTGSTTSTRDSVATSGLAATWGAGLTYVYDGRLTVGVDGMVQQWDDVSIMNNADARSKRMKVAVGAEYQPHPLGRNYFSVVKYRVGGYFTKPYYKVGGVRAANEYGITAGLALPIPRTRSLLNLSAQYVCTKGKVASFLDERTLRLCIGLTFNERWFFKRKVD